MLAKNVLKMVSALTYKDIKELKSLLAPYEELKSQLSPDAISRIKWGGQRCDQAFDNLETLIEMLAMQGRAVDRPVYRKASLKLSELRSALDED